MRDERDQSQINTHVLAGGGEMGARMRERDWAQTPLGPVEQWPQSLKTAVRIMLTSRQAMFVWWGEELINLYNDAYRSIVGGKHPHALGQPASVVWREIWDQVGPRAATAMRKNEGTYDEALLLIMERNGYPEETYYTFSYSPVPNDRGETGGIICANTDDTQRIVGERQLTLLRELAARTADARTLNDACALSAAGLATDPYDLPFAMVYLVDPDKNSALLAETAGIAAEHPAVPGSVSFDAAAIWPFAEAIATQQPRLVSDLSARFGSLPSGPWERAPHQAAIVPIAPTGPTGRSAILVAGLNPFRLFDDSYRGFLDLVAAQIAASLANAQAYEEARQRADALAELDQAKTAFFSNISHEFRTPLTLMLGPAEDALADSETTTNRERISIIHRNALRLLKLVNTLLDFSRIEAGRIQATYEPSDLSALTADLASVFRSAIERAGMHLIITCPPLPEPVYVDHEMWEKIVFNLLSNAFKFTFAGEIEISVRQADALVELRVRDTGTGIPAEELPRLFERFHRVSGARGRTFEGTGIGLALVQELARLHGGSVRVESVVNQGSIFTVAIPRGSAHLPPEQIGSASSLDSTALPGEAYVEEALRWLPGDDARPASLTEHPFSPAGLDAEPITATQDMAHGHILLADDNADMREYLRRLLSAQYTVEAVADGAAALAAARAHVPDLVLTDVMMPRLDGFGLLRELRADQRTAEIPVIMLSARAGEESRVEGLQAGVDDYLVKPFSARELLARIGARLELVRLRRESTRALLQREAALRLSEERLKRALHAARMFAWEWDPAVDVVITTDSFQQIWGLPAISMSQQGLDHIHPDDRERHQRKVQGVVERGGAYHSEFRVIRPDNGQTVWIEEWGFAADDQRTLVGVGMDITARKLADEALRRSDAEFRQLAGSVPQLIWTATADGQINFLNEQWRDYTGIEPTELYGWRWMDQVHPDDTSQTIHIWQACLRTGTPGELKHRLRHRSGTWRWQLVRALPLKDDDDQVVKWFGSSTDIHEQEQAGRDAQFLADIAERIRLADDATALPAEIVQMIGPYVQVTRCYFADIFEADNRWTIERDYAAEQPSIAGAYHITDYPDAVIQSLRAGHVLIAEDTASDPRSAVLYTRVYAPIGVRAHIIVPFLRNGQWVSSLVVADSVPRQWQPREISLLETVAERVWLAIEKLRAEQALRRNEERLQVLYAQEQAAREQAEAASHLKDEFLATVSHELRTPLTAILGYGELLQSRKRDEAYIARSLEKIVHSARAQAQLIDDLLDVSRIVTGKLRLEPRTLDLIAVIDAAIDAVRPAIEAKAIYLATDLKPPHDRIVGDPNRLQQVMWNLLSNAVKFTPSGGLIQVRLRQIDGGVQLMVSDTGQGITAEFLPYVFDRFRQAESTSSRTYGGLGLGLSIVRHLVEMHGGTVAVRSEGLGMGATFSVILPRAARDDSVAWNSVAADQSNGVQSYPPELNQLRVLVVDDQPDILDLLYDVLAPCGAVIKTCNTARDALATLQTWQPDVLVSDIAMPGQDGYWLIDHVRALPPEQGGRTPAVALTAYVRVEDRTRVLAAGFQMYVPKPVEPAELRTVVAHLARTQATAED